MKYEEAHKYLHPDTTRSALFGMNKTRAISLIEDACRVACKAIDKRLPQKVNIQANGGFFVGICPSCGLHITSFRKGYGTRFEGGRHSFCNRCGQRLDWGDNK